MRKRTFTIVASIVALVAVLLVAADSQAFLDKFRKDDNKSHQTGPFSVSGKFSGSVQGQIEINKQEVWITKNTAIYVIDKGPSRPGLQVAGRQVYASGKWESGVRVASMVVVRPASTKASKGSSHDKPYKVPSESNPEVGELKETIAE